MPTRTEFITLYSKDPSFEPMKVKAFVYEGPMTSEPIIMSITYKECNISIWEYGMRYIRPMKYLVCVDNLTCPLYPNYNWDLNAKIPITEEFKRIDNHKYE